MERKESSSGAPRYIEGMKSRNVWVIDIEIMNNISAIAGNVCKKVIEGINEIKIIETRFICIPGIRPVNVVGYT